MVRRILLPLDHSPYTESALELSFRIARATDAEITGLTILDLPGIEHSIGSVPLGGIYFAERLVEARKREAVDHITALLEWFDRRCTEAKVRHIKAEKQGSPSACIVEESLYYDLVVCGLRNDFGLEKGKQTSGSLEKILGNTATPVLAVPKDFTTHDPIHTLVAFDGSFPAIRSLHQFAELAPTGVFEVRLFYAHDDESAAKQLLKRAAEFLHAHGFDNVNKIWSPLQPIDEIQIHHLEWSDLVVLGMHSRQGILDFMVGSLSRFLIKEGNEALLLGQ